jgi:NAD-dependent deacetylase
VARLDPGRPIVVLTGAGISVESGLPTFRGPDGLWEGHRLEEVATPEAYARDRAKVLRFYDERRRGLQDPAVHPNPAHLALARLEREWPGGFLLVTQNVDDLHGRAGSTRVLHMHGELMKVRCGACGEVVRWTGDLPPDADCGRCRMTGRLRPHVVWFGEYPFGLERIETALAACGLFVAIGTSGQVWPAAGFVELVRRAGLARTVELNLEPSAMQTSFDEARYGPAGNVVPAFVDELLPACG